MGPDRKTGKRHHHAPVAIHGDRVASPFFGFRYPLTVAAIAAPLFVFYCYPYADNGVMAAGIHSYLSLYAKIVGTVLSALDPSVVVNGNDVAGHMFSVRIVQTCDAMEVNILLAAALAGFPMPPGRRLVTVLASVPSMTLINIIRLCVLYWVGAHAPSWFRRTHETLAPLLLVACALVIFLVATSRAKPESPKCRVGAT
jgi:exosortase/archaeosortase family protein